MVCFVCFFSSNNQALPHGHEVDHDWSTYWATGAFISPKPGLIPTVDMFNNEMNPCISYKPISIKAAITINTATQRNLLLLDFTVRLLRSLISANKTTAANQ